MKIKNQSKTYVDTYGVTEDEGEFLKEQPTKIVHIVLPKILEHHGKCHEIFPKIGHMFVVNFFERLMTLFFFENVNDPAMKYLSTNIENKLKKDKKIKAKLYIPKENTEVVPLGNANKDKVSLAVEYLPPGWYGKEEIRKFADTSFDSMDLSSKTKQTEGNKNIELKKEKVNDEESNSDESIDAEKQIFVSQIHKERELTKAGTGKICM